MKCFVFYLLAVAVSLGGWHAASLGIPVRVGSSAAAIGSEKNRQHSEVVTGIEREPGPRQQESEEDYEGKSVNELKALLQKKDQQLAAAQEFKNELVARLMSAVHKGRQSPFKVLQRRSRAIDAQQEKTAEGDSSRQLSKEDWASIRHCVEMVEIMSLALQHDGYHDALKQIQDAEKNASAPDFSKSVRVLEESCSACHSGWGLSIKLKSGLDLLPGGSTSGKPSSKGK